ncbi:MAG: glutathione S-transferase family protein [Gammaproteobacteria bacterium]
MSALTLVIGNRNYSSWSLRAWLVMKKSGLPFEVRLLSLQASTFDAAIDEYSPSGRVPVLWVGQEPVWDSLAICEYLNERVEGALWPADAMARAHARAITAEMHAGFATLRERLPMNCRAEGRRVEIDGELGREIARIETIWREAAERHGSDGGWLYGDFSIADAFYAPVASRFRTYGIPVGEAARRYMEHLLADEDVGLWYRQARAEEEVLEEEEVGL